MVETRSLSQIEQYYAGKTLLLTGATGLVGKVLLEALLRELPGIGKVFVLIRSRRVEAGSPWTPARRLQEEILRSSVFDPLRARLGGDFDAFVAQRLEAVEGDLALERLGLDPETYSRLQAEVDVVINSGALAVFDAPLDLALDTNTLGPCRVLDLARGGKKRPFVAHLSTCYVNKLAGPIFETPLDPRRLPGSSSSAPPFDVEDEVRAIQARVEELRRSGTGADATRSAAPAAPAVSGQESLERLVQEGKRWARRRGWNDTYAFTKAMGEQMFVRHQGDVPGLILRPSIIESSLRTPAPGWIEGFRMLDPIIVGFGRGQIFDFPGNPEALLDVVPVDLVVNALLAAIPWTHARGGPFLYQVASGMENPLILKVFRGYVRDYFERTPLRRSAAGGENHLPTLTFPEVRRFLRRLEYGYLLPLRVGERLLKPLGFTPWGRGRRASLGYRRARLEKLHHLAGIYGPYAESRARFLTFNVRSLWQSLSDEERERFPFSLSGWDWRNYVQEVHVPGIEQNLLRIRRKRVAAPVVPGAGEEGGYEARTEEQPWASQRLRTETSQGAARPAGPGRSAGPAQWQRAEKLLSLTRELEVGTVGDWTTPAYKKALQRASSRVIRLICKYRLQLRAEGHEHVPERGPFILVSNHTSHVDTGVLLAALGPHAAKVHPTAATDYWFRSPLLGWLLHSTLGAIPFARHAYSIPRALALPAEILRKGHSLIFYPEGERSPTGTLGPFRSTVGLLALASAAPVLPAYIDGAYEALPKGSSFIKHHPVRVRFGPVTSIEPYLGRLDRESVSAVARRLALDLHATVEALGRVRADA